MRVDRIEPTKNIVQGFQAYDTLLEQHPELHKKIVFLAFLVPSRESLALYRKYQELTLKTIDEVNEKYGTRDWTPIHAFVQNDRVVALTALQFYDALLVNPVIDGMNLVAKEGPAVNKNDGVLVLSRSSGAFQQLEAAAIPISPADSQETADALYTALMLPAEERKQLSQAAREEVERDDLHVWISQQIRDMNDLLSAK
jgi:trehalose 6-phosphate synthase